MDRLLHMLGTMYLWCVVHFSSSQWNIPTLINQVLHGRIVQIHVKVDTLCEQWWSHPGKKSGHMLCLLCHQGPLRTVCLQQDLDHVCLWPGYHSHYDTAKHGYCGVMKESIGEWNDALLSSVMTVRSVRIQVMDIYYVYSIVLVSVIFRSAFAHDTQVSP